MVRWRVSDQHRLIDTFDSLIRSVDRRSGPTETLRRRPTATRTERGKTVVQNTYRVRVERRMLNGGTCPMEPVVQHTVSSWWLHADAYIESFPLFSLTKVDEIIWTGTIHRKNDLEPNRPRQPAIQFPQVRRPPQSPSSLHRLSIHPWSILPQLLLRLPAYLPGSKNPRAQNKHRPLWT